ncbi:MAG: pyridoxal-phosphate dependent enzyme, partial [Elusimicrobiota bacterium]
RQQRNVQKMKLLGARVIPVTEGSKTLKAAVNAALRAWIKEPGNLYYLMGSCVGPHPYPLIVRYFQSVIGREVKEQLTGLPDYLVACVGGGSNALGLFHPFFDSEGVKFIGVEAAGAASLVQGKIGVLHGAKSYLLFDRNGQIKETHSVAPGLDYSGVGPQHSYFKDIKRASYYKVNDEEVLKAFNWLSKKEGIIPALESAHALAWTMYHKDFKADDTVVINISGRGDKDMDEVLKRIKL